jgi:hypothetical protein
MEWLRSNVSIPAAFTLKGPGTDAAKILADQIGLAEPNPF